MERFGVDIRSAAGSLEQERDGLASQNVALGVELRETRRAAAAADEDACERQDILTATNAGLMKDIADARGKSAPMGAELDAARAAASRMSEELDATRRSRADVAARLERANAETTGLEALVRERAAVEARLSRATDEANWRVSTSGAAAAASLEALRAKDIELTSSAARAAAAGREAALLRDESDRLRATASSVTSEMEALRAARSVERDAADVRLGEVLSDVRRVAEEARARDAIHADDAARHADELINVRRDAESALEDAADECSALGELLAATRADASAAAKSAEEARAGGERRVADLGTRLSIDHEQSAREATEMRAKLATATLSAARSSARDSERHEAALIFADNAAAVLRALQRDLAAASHDRNTLATALSHMIARVADAAGPDGLQSAALTDLYEDGVRSFEFLVDRVQGERRRVDAERDNVSVWRGSAATRSNTEATLL